MLLSHGSFLSFPSHLACFPRSSLRAPTLRFSRARSGPPRVFQRPLAPKLDRRGHDAIRAPWLPPTRCHADDATKTPSFPAVDTARRGPLFLAVERCPSPATVRPRSHTLTLRGSTCARRRGLAVAASFAPRQRVTIPPMPSFHPRPLSPSSSGLSAALLSSPLPHLRDSATPKRPSSGSRLRSSRLGDRCGARRARRRAASLLRSPRDPPGPVALSRRPVREVAVALFEAHRADALRAPLPGSAAHV